MTERIRKMYVNCPVCGKVLMKCKGSSVMEITCAKCSREIVVMIDEEKILVLENRRGGGKHGNTGHAKVSIMKNRVTA
ncbi:MAG: hypothetical protein K6G45_08825 [Lachnospiraceae bacterium]|nr:hypothetical protein [Lachnospiraceae bacterium]